MQENEIKVTTNNSVFPNSTSTTKMVALVWLLSITRNIATLVNKPGNT